MKTITKICVICHKEFSVPHWRESAKFCSHKCSHAPGEHAQHWQGGEVTINCAECGKPVTVRRARANKARYCSKECERRAKKGKEPTWLHREPKIIERDCAYCGKVMRLTSKEVFRQKRYCSIECRGKARRKEGTRVERRCAQCGKVFMVLRWRDDVFCSKSCSTSNRRGEKTSQWKGGISFEPYSPEFSQELKKRIRARDNNSCAICHAPARAVHHIDYDKNNTSPENLITLCTSCHSRTNSKRDYWIDFFHNLLSTPGIR